VAEAKASAPAGASTAARPPTGTTAEVAEAKRAMPHMAEGADIPYNGGNTEHYSWEQTLNDVTLQVPVPEGTRARDVVCIITKSRLTLKLRGSEPIIDGDYPCDARNGKEIWEKVRADECTWSLGHVSGKPCVSVYLEKERESWWKSALHGGIEIDTQKVDSTRSMYDYDGETQGAIRKIMFDEEQKRQGKPTSDQLKNEDLLRKAWDAEGSPFKGTPFDPSAINMGGGSTGFPGMEGMDDMPPMEPPM